MKTLGEQRALAAVPKLLETFVANAGKNNFAVAKALARIGDPAAIPVLLKHPHMVDDDLLGNTERELASFGPAADLHFEKLIVNWRRVRAGSEAESLPIALKLLGPRGSAEVVGSDFSGSLGSPSRGSRGSGWATIGFTDDAAGSRGRPRCRPR